jgi:hypothetical protein
MVSPVTKYALNTLVGSGQLTPSHSDIMAVGVNPAGFDTTQHKAASKADLRNLNETIKYVVPAAVAVTRRDAYTNPTPKKQPEVPGAAEGQVSVAPPRPMTSGTATNIIGQVGSVGNAAMQAEFMIPMGAWAFRNTIGQFSLKARQAVGAVSYAPFKALWNSSVKDVLTGNWKDLKANYYHAFHDYTTGAPFGKKYQGWQGLKDKAFAINGSTEMKTLEKVTEGNMFQRMWNGRAYGVLLKTGLTAASLYLGIKAVASLRHSISQMQELGQDLFGEQYSTWQILMNPKSMPEFMQEVRGNMVAHLMPETAHAVGESGSNWALSDGMHGIADIRSKMGMAKQVAMIGGMVISTSAQNMAPSENLLTSYTMLKDTMKGGHKAPVELYGLLVEAASADARMAGGANGRLVRAIAESYAKENKTAVEVLKEIDAKEPYLQRAKAAAGKIKAEDELLKAKAKPTHSGPIVAKASHMEAAQPLSDKPGLMVAKEGLVSHGKIRTPQVAAEV